MHRFKAVCVGAVGLLLAVAAAPALVLFARTSRVRVAGARHARGSPVGSHFLEGEAHRPARWSHLEDEYVRLLARAVTALDPFMPAAEARAARAKIDELLAAVGASPDYRGLARVGVGMGVRLLRGRLDPRHCYTYRPEPRTPGEQFGLLVFLHGHGTNYLFVVHALRPLCDRLRLCLVAPTFGYGNWEAPGGAEAIDRAARFGLSAFGADPARVYLAGLSQGGAGVGRAGQATPERYAGLIFISPEMERSVLGSPEFLNGWRGRPVLVIQGERDRNVHPRTVDAACELLGRGGVAVTQHRDPDAGHFLLFAKRNKVFEVIERWVNDVSRG